MNAEISADRELVISLPEDFPLGPAEVVVRASSRPFAGSTFGDLADSEFFGMWNGREDLNDVKQFASDLRLQGWKRLA